MAYENSLKQFFVLQCFILVYFVQSITSVSLQPGVFDLTLSENTPAATFKSLFKDTVVHIAADTTEGVYNSSGTVRLSWELRYTQCEGLYGIQLNESPQYEDILFGKHTYMFAVEHYINVAANESLDITFEKVTPELAFGNYTWNDWICYVGNVSNTKFEECKQGTDNETKQPLGNKNVGSTGNTAEASGAAGAEGGAGEAADAADGTGEAADAADGTGEAADAGDGKGEDDQTGTNMGNGNPPPVKTSRRKRGENDGDEAKEDDTKDAQGDEAKKDETKDAQTAGNSNKMKNDQFAEAPGKKLVQVQESGSYLLIMKLEVLDGDVTTFPVRVHMKGKHGYLSAFQYKLLPFYGIMCGLYMLMGFTWLFLMCYQYKDLLGIQIWIGVVILLGLVEKAVFFGEFEHMNNFGEESSLGILFPEIVSCTKRTLARLLVVVVSIGYGITRPRLGNDLNYIMAAGLTYLILSSAEAIMRTNQDYERTMVAVLPLSILDAILVWWIFRNLVDTSRVLRLRQNETKLWLYRHFTNTLLLCVLMSVIFFIWSMKTHAMNECIIKWEELWLDDAFWHVLFCVILTVIMILFRPSINNQRYAYSPLVDDEPEGDEGSKEPMLSEAYDGMKMRNLKKDNPQNAVMDIADDLKWVEDNIPAAIADTALSMMDDSEDELMANTERSKMD